ncbi:pyridoxamine 5'-phosphate oxidase family protein [Ilumatobacter sp.]|uniref:pyridoxamine 5'-phosphate oxidase family protein n=1 Tax=Ilumatobacter sp. TaxID=1967498 RepID=UPI003C361980
MATSDAPIQQPANRRDPSSTVELSESECLHLLDGADVGRLAVQLPEGGVDIFPVNFVIDEGRVLLRTAAGAKLESLMNEPIVAFEADSFDYYEHAAWSVVVKGHASLVVDHNELFRLLNVELDTWHPERKPYFVRISPASITGRRFAIHRRVEP